jgi:hypothetical protein
LWQGLRYLSVAPGSLGLPGPGGIVAARRREGGRQWPKAAPRPTRSNQGCSRCRCPTRSPPCQQRDATNNALLKQGLVYALRRRGGAEDEDQVLAKYSSGFEGTRLDSAPPSPTGDGIQRLTIGQARDFPAMACACSRADALKPARPPIFRSPPFWSPLSVH